jgi:hypothetical protein
MTMRQDEQDLAERLGQSLGASRAVSLPGPPSGGPLDLMQLRAEVALRLKSSEGRPTEPPQTDVASLALPAETGSPARLSSHSRPS